MAAPLPDGIYRFNNLLHGKHPQELSSIDNNASLLSSGFSRWRLEFNNGSYLITHLNTGRVLDLFRPGNQVHVWEKHGRPNQLWTITPVGSKGKYEITSVENPALKVGAMEDFSAKTAVVKVNAEATDGIDEKREWAITIHK
ncbi:hypothetical protein DFP73DRAFT_601633 [Morchella snyderi]|nr:hypothetical protein DFP73DRAFT_601633 [Morchella snyderi]